MEPSVVFVGVDVGAESSKVVLGPRQGCDIVRNEVGGHTTPTVISLSGDVPQQPRPLGTKKSNPNKNTVYHLNRLLPDELRSDGTDLLQAFYTFSRVGDGMIENLEYNGEEPKSFSAAALLGMLLGKLQQNVKATLQRQQGDTSSSNNNSLSFALACPSDLSTAAQQELLDAAYAAGIDSIQLVDRNVAYQATYSRKFPERLDKYVLIVDMGHTDTSVSVIGPAKKDEQEQGGEEAKKETEEEEEVLPFMTVLASERQKGLGAGSVDVRLWNHFQSTHAGLATLTPNSRGGQRLLASMSKLKHLLSQLPEGNVTVENVGKDDADVSLEASRSMLVELCKEEVQAMTALIEKVVASAGIGIDQLHSVEVVGGGCRMPWVKDVLEKATQKTLSHTLDDTSAALGAALIGEQVSPMGILARRAPEEEPTERQKALRAAEEKMAKLDEELQLRSATLNQMESHILGLRSAKHEEHGDLLPAELFTYLDTMEDWLFSPEADEAGYEELLAKWQEVQDKTGELSKAYKDAMETDRKAKESEMEAEAKQAQKEREGDENEGDEEGHDNRRLPKKRRMEIVMKNKNEGGELFSDGNFSKLHQRFIMELI